MVLEVLVSVSHFAATTPAIVVVLLGASLFLVGILALAALLMRNRRSTPCYRKGGVFLSPREDPPLLPTRTPHLVLKKSPSPPFASSPPKGPSPSTPPNKSSSTTVTIQTNPFCEERPRLTNHLTKGPKSPPQLSPSTPTSLPPTIPTPHPTNPFLCDLLNERPPSPPSAAQVTPNNNKRGAEQEPPKDINLISHEELSSLSSSAVVAPQENAENGDQPVVGGGEHQLGILHFRIRYADEKGTLVVTVVGADGLPPKDGTLLTADPYVKLTLLPEKTQRVKTRVLRHTRSPSFNEDFTFYNLTQQQVEGMTLHFVVLSFDRYSRDDVIGEVFYPLETAISQASPLDIAMDILPRNFKMQTQSRGEVLLSLCWQPTARRLTVVVLKARGLPKMDLNGLADPYVKLALLQGDRRLLKKKTHVKKRTLSPVYNESFIFDLPAGVTLEGLALQVQLLDWDRVTKNEVIGKVELGPDGSSPSAKSHWQEVLNSPRRQIAEWHKLI